MELRPGQGTNLFLGANGEGKTNILEALFGTIRGKSFRPYCSKADWVPEGQGQLSTAVGISFEDERGFPLDARLERASGSSRWDFYFNGKRSYPFRLREKIPAVAFSPDDHALVRSGPEMRRDYLDEVFTDICPGYAEVLSRFEKSLKSRNRLLKLDEQTSATREELRVWTHVLAEASSELSLLRAEIWDSFAERFVRIGGELFTDLGPRVEISFEPDLAPTSDGKDLTDAYLEAFEAALSVDLATRWTHRGPHRDDFCMKLNGLDSRSKASQGQARILALLLKWVHAEWVKTERGEAPIFFIDDLSSELDSERRRRLLDLVKSLSGQIFVTGTEASVVDSGPIYDYTQFVVKKGAFEPQQRIPRELEKECPIGP